MEKEARFWVPRPDGRVVCQLCPHNCRIESGKYGGCGARFNDGGRLMALSYGRITSAAVDPVEKKPLYHFHPGESIFSIGSFGCSLHCVFCQNYGISQGRPPSQFASPEEVAETAVRHGSFAVAYTYNEPLIWMEYLIDAATAARARGLKNVLVTNGFVNPEPLAALLPLVDAANVDLKSMDDSFYKRLCGARLKPVLDACAAMKRAGVHVEVTNLVVTGENDSERNFVELRDWVVAELGVDTPVHLSAYYPAYRFSAPPTPLSTLETAYEVMRGKLHYVYLGNVRRGRKGHDTVCRDCGALLVERSGYSTRVVGLDGDGRCAACGADNNFVVGPLDSARK